MQLIVIKIQKNKKEHKEVIVIVSFGKAIDQNILQRINDLIKDYTRNSFKGIAKPEPLRGSYAGFLSRRITAEQRLVYALSEKRLPVLKCRFHYGKYGILQKNNRKLLLNP